MIIGGTSFYKPTDDIILSSESAKIISDVVANSFPNNNSWVEFLIQAGATIFGGLILYCLLERRLKKQLEIIESKKILNNVKADLKINKKIAEDIVKDEKKYFKQGEFPAIKFTIEGLYDFFKNKPKLPWKQFQYQKLRKLIQELTMINNMSDIFFLTVPHIKPQHAEYNKKSFLSM